MTNFTESEVEDAAFGWLAGCGWGVAHGPDIVDADYEYSL